MSKDRSTATQRQVSRHLQRSAMVALLLATAVSAGCGSSPSPGTTGQMPQGGQSSEAALPTAMNPEEAKTFLAENPQALLLDVRNPPEWESELTAIEGAKLLPLPELAGRLEELADWKTRPVVIVCRSGRRSEQARRILAEAGFEKAINLSGGMLAWQRAGY